MMLWLWSSDNYNYLILKCFIIDLYLSQTNNEFLILNSNISEILFAFEYSSIRLSPNNYELYKVWIFENKIANITCAYRHDRCVYECENLLQTQINLWRFRCPLNKREVLKTPYIQIWCLVLLWLYKPQIKRPSLIEGETSFHLSV